MQATVPKRRLRAYDTFVNSMKTPRERCRAGGGRLEGDGNATVWQQLCNGPSPPYSCLVRSFLWLWLVVSLPTAAGAQTTTWTYGGFADLGYLFAPADPVNGVFRSRGTAWHLNDLYVNMAGVYARRPPTAASRWGGEVTVHSGKDDEIFGFSATAPNIAGDEWLRHLGPTNVSYLVDAGEGLTVQGGIFSSLIGYDSLYAKDNLNYTRHVGVPQDLQAPRGERPRRVSRRSLDRSTGRLLHATSR